MHGSSKAEDRFVTLRYKDWKHASGKGERFFKHDGYKHHQEAMMNWAQFKSSVSSGTSVASTLDNARSQQITKNHHYLKAIIRAIVYCSTQDIGLRGHRKGESPHNKANFQELVDVIAVYDPIVNDRLTNGP